MMTAMNMEELARHRILCKVHPQQHQAFMPALQMLHHCYPRLVTQSRADEQQVKELEGLVANIHLPKTARRCALVALPELLDRVPCLADRPRLYKLVVQVLREPDTTWQPWFAAAVLRLAQTLAASCCRQQQSSRQEQQEKQQSSQVPEPAYGGLLVPPSGALGRQGAAKSEGDNDDDIGDGMTEPKRRRLFQSQHQDQGAQATQYSTHTLDAGEAQQATHAAGKSAFGGTSACEHGRGLSWAHVNALQKGLVAWCGHWHPRVRRAALTALLTQHQHQPQHQHQLPLPHKHQVPHLPFNQYGGPACGSICVCANASSVTSSYKAAVVALGDDHEGVRLLALQLVAVLACAQPNLRIQDPRFRQFNRTQPLVDDGFQRLCSAASNDPDMGVRRAALQKLEALQGASLRVKLQALNKKATVVVEVPKKDTAISASDSRLSNKLRKGKGNQQQQQEIEDTRQLGGGPWAGDPNAHSLDLLDASVGALVHGTEDEVSQVRAATAAALTALGASELYQIAKVMQPTALQPPVLPPMLSEIASAPETAVVAAPTAATAEQALADVSKQSNEPQRGAPSVDADVLAERRQAACQSSEFLVDLLHDEVPGVREAAAQGLMQLAMLARLSTVLGPRDATSASSLLAVLLDRDQMLSLMSGLGDPVPMVRSCSRTALSYMSFSTPALLRSLALALAQNAVCFPAEADAAFAVASTAATNAPSQAVHAVGTALVKLMEQSRAHGQQTLQLLQGMGGMQTSEQLLIVAQTLLAVAGNVDHL